MNDRYAKYGAATGIVFAVLVIIGFGIVMPNPPDLDSPAQEWSKYYTDHQDAIRAAVLILSVSLFFFVWFLGSLSSALRAAIGNPRLPSVAFGGGVLAAASLTGTLGATAVAAYRPEESAPQLVQVLNDTAVLVAVPGIAGLTALLAATAIVFLRSPVLPDWLGWVSAVGAVVQPLGFGAIFTQTGAFAGDGVLGLYVPIIGLLVTVGALSVVLMQRVTDEPGAGGITGRIRGAVSGAAAGAQGRQSAP
jgi:hypothetical protein